MEECINFFTVVDCVEEDEESPNNGQTKHNSVAVISDASRYGIKEAMRIDELLDIIEQVHVLNEDDSAWRNPLEFSEAIEYEFINKISKNALVSDVFHDCLFMQCERVRVQVTVYRTVSGAYHICFGDDCPHIKRGHACIYANGQCPHAISYSPNNTYIFEDITACTHTGHLHFCGKYCTQKMTHIVDKGLRICPISRKVLGAHLSNERDDWAPMIAGYTGEYDERVENEMTRQKMRKQGENYVSKLPNAAASDALAVVGYTHTYADTSDTADNIKTTVAKIDTDKMTETVVRELLFSTNRQTMEFENIVNKYADAINTLQTTLIKQNVHTTNVPDGEAGSDLALNTVKNKTIKRDRRKKMFVDHTVMCRANWTLSNMLPKSAFFTVFGIDPSLEKRFCARISQLTKNKNDQRRVVIQTRIRENLKKVVDRRRHLTKTHGHQGPSVAPENPINTAAYATQTVLLIQRVVQQLWVNITTYMTAPIKNISYFIVPLIYMLRDGFTIRVPDSGREIVVVPVIDILKFLPHENTLIEFCSIRGILTRCKDVRAIQQNIKSMFNKIALAGHLFDIEIKIEKFL